MGFNSGLKGLTTELIGKSRDILKLAYLVCDPVCGHHRTIRPQVVLDRLACGCCLKLHRNSDPLGVNPPLLEVPSRTLCSLQYTTKHNFQLELSFGVVLMN